MSDALLELAARCEALTDFETPAAVALNNAIHDLLPEPKCVQPPNYLASLDAAMTLLDPTWFFHVSRFSPESDGRGKAHVYPNRGLGDDYEGDAATPALALCAAALRARAAQ